MQTELARSSRSMGGGSAVAKSAVTVSGEFLPPLFTTAIIDGFPAVRYFAMRLAVKPFGVRELHEHFDRPSSASAVELLRGVEIHGLRSASNRWPVERVEDRAAYESWGDVRGAHFDLDPFGREAAVGSGIRLRGRCLIRAVGQAFEHVAAPPTTFLVAFCTARASRFVFGTTLRTDRELFTACS